MRSANKLVASSPSVMMGKPVIAGTRITVDLSWISWRLVKPSNRFSMHIHDLPAKVFKPHWHSQRKPCAPMSSIP